MRPQSAVVLSEIMIIEKDLDASAISCFGVTLCGILNAYDVSRHMVSISSWVKSCSIKEFGLVSYTIQLKSCGFNKLLGTTT